MSRDSQTRITQVRVRLRGAFSFPITLGNEADPSMVEREIESLAQSVLRPGYPTKPNPESRIGAVMINAIPDHYLQPDGSYRIPYGAKDVYAPLEDLPSTCTMIVENGQDDVKLHFNDAASGKTIRSLRFSHAFLKETIETYLAEQDKGESYIRGLHAKLDALPESAAGERAHMLNLIKASEAFRKDTHHVGSESIGSAAKEQGVTLRNRTLTQDLEARVFELLAFLMRDGTTYPVPPANILSRRQPGSFKDVKAVLT